VAKILSEKACIVRLFYWTKVTKFVKVTKSDEKHCPIRYGLLISGITS